MSAAKHTRGPWRIRESQLNVPADMTVLLTIDGVDVLAPRSLLADDPMTDARLIVAAPELLAALERLTAACESSGVERSDIVAARAALAKVGAP